jgi:hypothetical protein
MFLNCNIDFLLAYIFLSEQERVDETSDVIAITNDVIREVTLFGICGNIYIILYHTKLSYWKYSTFMWYIN